MNESIIKELESKKIEELYQEYKGKGYEVIVSPSKEQLPDFLSTFEIDLLAINQDEKVVIEVKSNNNLKESKYLQRLAEIIHHQNGWKFELVITHSGNDLLTSDLPSSSVLLGKLDDIKKLIAGQQMEAAFILTCSIFEAAARKLLIQEFPKIKLELSSISTIKQLFSYGLIGRVPYNQLLKMVEIRDDLVHGFFSQSERRLSKDIQLLTEIVNHILSETNKKEVLV